MFDVLMPFVPKFNDYRSDFIIIFRGKNLRAQAENRIFHTTHGAVPTIQRRERTLPYIGRLWDTVDNVKQHLRYSRNNSYYLGARAYSHTTNPTIVT